MTDVRDLAACFNKHFENRNVASHCSLNDERRFAVVRVHLLVAGGWHSIRRALKEMLLLHSYLKQTFNDQDLMFVNRALSPGQTTENLPAKAVDLLLRF